MHELGKRISNLRVSVIFGLLVFVHLALSAIDRFSQVSVIISFYIFILAAIIRALTRAKRLGDLLRWAKARKAATAIWLMGTLSIFVQTMWLVVDGEIDINISLTSTIFASFFFGLFIVLGDWIWQRVIGIFKPKH